MSIDLLSVKDLKTYFYTDDGIVRAVDGVSFTLGRGKTLGIVGESGSGKSIASLSILKLIPQPPGRIVQGEILFNGEDISQYDNREMRAIRGNEISMIFQEPMTSLNPVYTIGNQIVEAIRLHQDKMTRGEVVARAAELLKLVRIPNADKALKSYPHELSGGMRQRVMIAMALSCKPKLLICDEPTTALDVTVQAQILALIDSIKKESDMSIIFITHDLAVIKEMADEVIVMYAGKIMEQAAVQDLFENPLHPYTNALFKSRPTIENDEEELYTIKGTVPSPYDRPKGCLFASRCDYTTEECLKEDPRLVKYNNSLVRCVRYCDGGRDSE